MTDTPRTEAELLTIFADQQNHGITAQDMRDFVATTAGLRKAEAFSLFCVNQSIPVPTNTTVEFAVDPADAMYTGTQDVDKFLYDPNGYGTTSADDPDPYYGLPGGQYLSGIPKESVWCAQLVVTFAAGTFTTADFIQQSAPFIGPNYAFPGDPADDTAAGIFAAPTYAFGAFKHQAWFPNAILTSDISTMPFYADERFDTWNILAPWVLQNSGETQTVTSVEIDVWRIR